MVNEEVKKDEGNGINRRNFLKGAGVIVAGSTLGAAQAMPTAITNFRYPIDTKDFNTFADLQNHFAEANREAVNPITPKLNVNGKDCEVLIESHWTLSAHTSSKWV